MKVDFHVHLEEGPYSLRWLQRTADALLQFHRLDQPRHTKAWLDDAFHLLSRRVSQGAFSTAWLDLYREQAKRRGLQEVGIVDHLYRFRECKGYYEKHMLRGEDQLGRLQAVWLDQVCMASLEEYVSFIQAEQARWAADGIQLRLGIEADYFEGGENELASILGQYAWDHVIGSVHFVDGWGFDNPDTLERFKEVHLPDLYRRFFQLVEQAIDSRLFDIAAHLDNLKVFDFRPDEALLQPYYERIAASLQRNDMATEINTGLYYRYPVKEACPSFRFLSTLQRYGVPITTSSDSHFPDHLGQHLDWARDQLRQAGFSKIVRFEQRIRKEVDLE